MKYNFHTIFKICILIFIVLTLANFLSYYLNLKLFRRTNSVISKSVDTKGILNVKNNSRNRYTDEKQQFQVEIDGLMYPIIIPLKDNRSLNFSFFNKESKTKLILYWTPFYDLDTFYYGLGKHTPFINNKCPVYNCEATKDKSRYGESDLVVFSLVNPIDMNEIPKYRNPNQEWAMVLIESPVNVPGSRFLDLHYNLSVTYRSDSDTYSHYAYENELVWALNEEFDDKKDYLLNKSEFSVALISNCHDKSGRLQYIKEMRKYVPVTIFGRCGDPCPKNGDCKEIVSKNYKFYLAFENSLCKDYITEKFFISLRYDIIPVVLGIGDYEKFIPKSGFINVLDYASPKELSEHLIYLSNNSTAYNSYFKWKKYVKRRSNKSINVNEDICELCIKLHADSYNGQKTKTRKSIANLASFWNSEKDCKDVNDYPALKAK